MDIDQLNEIAIRMTAPGKGILAADESTRTIGKRFDGIGLENTEENRRNWREMLFRTTPAMTDHVSGVILFDETIRQKAADGTPLVKLITDAGAVPGIKVDAGAKALAGAEGETVTEGLDGLRERLAEYYELGARFAKWRAVIDVNGEDIPSQYAVDVNVHALARYAALCQEANIVPIVEPEVLMDGDHSIERCYEVTEFTLKRLYAELFDQGVILEGTVLKPNMVIAGKKCADQASREEVAEMTVQCLLNTVPAAVPGIAFLSGGQSDEDATAHLNIMNEGFDLPWPLTFSYGRALQAAPLKAWGGSNVEAGQKAFNHRARMNGLAALGEWNEGLESEG
ncbi:MAG: fructose-bisphosphate aldolase class I [Oceanicaulis sp.]|jgi:fructose-bisphosphate aldolase class I|uniref:class I fructose-bisphosphate aldolase n=1 Tax=unclassified Oceanicaulis TaxID=2632123 RepID=UPI000066A209|nr:MULTISPECIES: class I fructose-bisphosphate aldolase [unclassified Oceanicaulis]EAP90171.1 fructose bisphosphate aldolase [Oceanicaulis sp. HTCC2633]MAB70844.1 fructose-bisphosphate aldolase class I [Oceanicaulis sp.]MBC39080.1 fructose-bisphosphate aldolase class I [Oceanicaulis sp.]MBC40482.1 fructose-bisphosphate aldolase class I [Oceanicaulis sp.]MBG35280.1 fructose-bisphosphate aldolase class I [Oceanicaulis sp.]|tara:strand:+ start:225 stop:1244 length:1020 start_codon:yes stop_codon:yes gene_type:complete